MTSRTFSQNDQDAFARLSGDFNPLHVDPVHARRLMFGKPAVHGVHTLLWCLDCWAASFDYGIVLTSLAATFSKPVRVGAAVEFRIRKQDDSTARLIAVVEDETVLRADIAWTPGADTRPVASDAYPPSDPIEEPVTTDRHGELERSVDPDLLARLLPNVARWFSRIQVAELLASTRLVGMISPGLHSIYSELSLQFTDTTGEVTPLLWRVEESDPRFSLVVMSLQSDTVTGEVRAFERPAPRAQTAYRDLKALVDDGAFAGQRALVVGGSRGLGEVAAKLLAAGGAEVMLTYNQGRADAEALVSEIADGGGSAAAAAFNVLDASPEGAAEVAAWKPTCLYFFATPFIETGKRRAFSADLFARFSQYYVAGLLSAVERLPTLEMVFNPSSVFVEETPDTLMEYAAAKAASEFVAARLADDRAGKLRVVSPRLPKMDTDQTASLSASEPSDPAPVMLAVLQDALA